MRTRSLLITGAALVCLAGTAAAQTAAPTQAPAPASTPASAADAQGKAFEGIFRIGGVANSTSGNLGIVGEYLPLKDAATVGGETWGNNNGFRYDLAAYYGGTSRDQNYRADLDFKRLVKAHVSYQKFGHRLEHDPITYMDASSGLGGTFVAQNTDTDPGAAYSLGFGEFKSRVDVSLPTKLPVQFFVGHNRQTRDGAHQVMTVAHCSSCHLYSYSRKLDEVTSEMVAGARLQARALTVEYGYENSSFKDDTPDITMQYDNAIQPQTLVDMFLNRVQYDDGNGLLPIATTPAIKKQLHTLRGRLQLPGDATLLALFAHSNQKNEDTQLEIDYSGFSGRLFVPVKPWLSFKADLRRYDIDSDDVFVHVAENVAPAGLTAGLTYEQAYPTGELDFTRESSLSRTPTDLTLELGLRPAKFTFLRAGYQWNEVKRKAFEIDKTTTNTIFVTGRSRFGKHANGRFRFQLDEISDPFVYENAAIPKVLQPYPSPGTPASPLTGLQYFQMYDSRQGNLTAFPTSSMRFDGMFTLTPNERTAVTMHYNYRHQKNDELNYSDWGRTAHTPGVDVFISPGKNWTLSAGYVYHQEKLETLFSTLAFAG